MTNKLAGKYDDPPPPPTFVGLIKTSLCTGFLKKLAYQIGYENCLGPNQPFTKFVEAANNLTKLV